MRSTLATLLSSSDKCYYESLNVPEDASLDDIKEKFRTLSKAHHPDVAVGCPQQNAEKFKEISNAYQTLSNPKERRRYDREREEQLQWYRHHQNHNNSNNRGFGGGFGSHLHPHHNTRRPGPQGPRASGAYAVLETIFYPRNFIVGLGFIVGASIVYSNVFGTWDERKKLGIEAQKSGHHRNSALCPTVEAWKNPQTGRWEQAAPWDPVYQKLQPKLEQVPRDQVHKRTR